MVHVTAMLPLSLIFSPLRGMLPRKKYPLALLLPRDEVRYDASEWMLSTILDALNWRIAFGLVCIYCKRCWTRCIVCSIGLACSAGMELRDNKIVRSTALAYYRKMPTTCWMYFLSAYPSSGLSGSTSMSSDIFPYCIGFGSQGLYCGRLGGSGLYRISCLCT